MKTKVSSNPKPKSSIPHCPYEIPISTIYNPSSNDSDIPVVSIYNPNLNQNTRPPETKPNLQKICLEKLKAQFHKDQRKKHEFYMAVCFLITLVATGAIIVIMHKSTTKDLLLVHGEFTILNVEYSSKLMHRNSSEFLQISKEICHSVDMTFLVPGLSDYYRSCHVTAISPNLNVHVLLTFANDPSVTIGQIGLTFIKGLRILHGKTWLGAFSINVQSIGFMISGQEGQWGEWSEWSKCNATLRVSTRTRPCLSRTGVKLSSVDRCLLIPGLKGDLDIGKCSPVPWETEHIRVLNNDKSTEDTKSSREHNEKIDTKVDSQPQEAEVIEVHDTEELNHPGPRVRKERTN
uniref:SEA domain-containing protein n=1 Tax=Cacopsylla melanoneura TaxID=428564 RepID=A0A8D8R284_9HEMI